MTIVLSEALSEPVTLNIVGDGSTATYGIPGVGVWELARNPVPPSGTSARNDLSANALCGSIVGGNCPITLQAGATIVDVAVFPVAGTSGTTAIISVVISSGSDQLVRLGNTPTVTLTF